MPFVSKTTGVPLASLAARGDGRARRSTSSGFTRRGRCSPYVAVKEAVFPFSKLPGVDLLLGPEMRSTGEVMGIADCVRHGVRQGAGRGRRRAAARGRRSS